MKLLQSDLKINLHIISTPEMLKSRVTDYVSVFVPFEEAQVILGLKDTDQDAYEDLQFTNNDDACNYCGSGHVDYDRWNNTTLEKFCKRCHKSSYVSSDISPSELNAYPH